MISPKQAWTAEALIDAYGDELLRLCLLYLGDRQLAEDAFQETMVKAWRALPDFRGESGAKTWLFHIAVNICRDMLRSGWMRMRKSSVPLEVMPELAGQEDGHLRELTASVLALPGKYREIIVLFYYKQMKIREIAEALHMPTASVSSRLRRARAMLKIDMEGERTHEGKPNFGCAARVDERRAPLPGAARQGALRDARQRGKETENET
ncbi:MAG: sigma-70 family RNA polymerase sigma factor [Christensenellales bacterium]